MFNTMKFCLTLVRLVCTWEEAGMSSQGNKHFLKKIKIFIPLSTLFSFFFFFLLVGLFGFLFFFLLFV